MTAGSRKRQAFQGSSSLFTAARPKRTFEEIITQIQGRIQDGTIKKGDRLPSERDLAVQFEVSRNTVREALRTLEISGYIVLKRGAGGGAFVMDTEPQVLNDHLTGALRLTDFSVSDLTQAMRSMTVMLLTTAAPLITDADLAALEANVAEARAITDDPRRRTEVVLGFYRILAEGTGNKIRLGSLTGERVFASRERIIMHLRDGQISKAQAELENYLEELHHLWLRG
jgi:DNA-binding FadR family transcriptional regulator